MQKKILKDSENYKLDRNPFPARLLELLCKRKELSGPLLKELKSVDGWIDRRPGKKYVLWQNHKLSLTAEPKGNNYRIRMYMKDQGQLLTFFVDAQSQISSFYAHAADKIMERDPQLRDALLNFEEDALEQLDYLAKKELAITLHSSQKIPLIRELAAYFALPEVAGSDIIAGYQKDKEEQELLAAVRTVLKRSQYPEAAVIAKKQDLYVPQGSSAVRKNKRLYSYDAGPCVIVALYSPDTRTAALSHIDALTKITGLFTAIFKKMGVKNGQANRLQVNLIGGEKLEFVALLYRELLAEGLNPENINIVLGETNLLLDPSNGEAYRLKHRPVRKDKAPELVPMPGTLRFIK